MLEPVLSPPFGTVRDPVAMMMHEHDSAGDALRTMRQLTTGYMPPDDACISYQKAIVLKTSAGRILSERGMFHLLTRHGSTMGP